MSNLMPPATILIFRTLLVPLVKGKLKSVLLLLLPALAFVTLLKMPLGKYWTVQFLAYHLIFGRVDKLSIVFGYISPIPENFLRNAYF
jgi:multicomponent Na+:H+ antiporter subunit D